MQFARKVSQKSCYFSLAEGKEGEKKEAQTKPN